MAGGDARDEHRSVTWRGLKRPARRVLAWPPVNVPVTRAIRALGRPGPAARLPVAGDHVAGAVLGAEFVLLDPLRCANAKDLWWGRGEPTVAADRSALRLAVTLARESDVFYDIGAHTGLFTMALTAANPALRAHAFEVVPAVFPLLYANGAANDVLDRIRCHHVGLGVPGTVHRFPLRWEGAALPSALSSLVSDPQGAKVAFEALDAPAWAPSPGDRVLIKVDVERTEASVLIHGRTLLATWRPDIICELLPGGGHEEVADLLLPLGYRSFLITAEGLEEHDRPVPVANHRDWFLTTRTPDRLPVVR